MVGIKKILKTIFKRQVIILMYHRIANPSTDPWELAVDAKNFEDHLQILKRDYNVQPLPKIIEQLQQKKIKRKCIAITFDDGYIDNYSTAKPLLEKYNLPATFFITSKNIDSKDEFWWDELGKIFLQSPILPPELSLEINGNPFYYNLAPESVLTEELQNRHANFVAYKPDTLRSSLYYKLWEFFSPMPAKEQLQLMKQIREWAGVNESSREEYGCMSSYQAEDMSSDNLFSIGGHTMSHLSLPSHEKEIQYKEILMNKIYLENITGKKINLFAYPSGNYNDSTIEVLKQVHFKAAFTTNAQPVKKRSDPYTLGRFQVNNWSGDKFRQMLLKWCTY
jgi:peptidoglycan/xylan/chitin deacetylase (PgdA/CDA1 family)